MTQGTKKKYEVWFAPNASAMTVRIEWVYATSEVSAYREASKRCEDGEFVRGVREVESCS